MPPDTKGTHPPEPRALNTINPIPLTEIIPIQLPETYGVGRHNPPHIYGGKKVRLVLTPTTYMERVRERYVIKR